MPKNDLLQGTLDLLLLRVLALGPDQGWGISLRIRQMSEDGLHRTGPARGRSIRPCTGWSCEAI